MTSKLIVPEPDVLVATTYFLVERGVTPFQFSVASGRGIDTAGCTDRLTKAFAGVGFKPNFSGNGADIVGFSDSEWWIVECKGSGSGQPQTQRNNFDRALASVTSYFEDEPPHESKKHLKVCLGLALPSSDSYLRELKRRVRQPLRRRLNLYVLLYDATTRRIQAISPDAEY